MLAPHFADRQLGVRFLQDLHDRALRKSYSLHANLPAKACQKVLPPADLALGRSLRFNQVVGMAGRIYGILDSARFNECLKLINQPLIEVMKAKFWTIEAIKRTARWFLRGRFLEHPQVQWNAEYEDAYRDVLLHYVICLENLLMVTDEREAIGDKVAVRGAWLVGRSDDERNAVFRLIKQTYDARSKVVHRADKRKKDKNKAIEFRRVRDLCRRAMAAALLVSADHERGETLDDFLTPPTDLSRNAETSRKIG